jgi:F-type H+-transporting ATPase subunit delta
MLTGGAIKRYAQAVFELARADDAFERWQRDLRAMAELVSDPAGQQLFDNPKIDRAQKARVAERYLQPRVTPVALNLARLLIQRDRFGQAERLVTTFEELVRDHQGVAVAEVVTAVPLDSAASAEISQQLGAVVGKRVELRRQVDPSIIGGIVARIDDYLIDGSVTGQLSRLRTRLMEGR